MAPVISVLLPVYNGARHLERAVQSVLDQSFGDFECLILDDGSSDGAPAILDRLAASDDRIRLIRRENRGLVPTLNELIGEARGRYLARMDGDDIALPDRFAAQVTYLEANPAIVCVGGAQALIDEEGRYLTDLVPPTGNAGIQAAILAGHGAICHPTAMIRAEAMAQVGGYDPAMRHCEDLDLWLRLGEVGELANLAEIVLRYRLSTSSVSALNWAEQRKNGLAACQAAWARRGITEGHYEAGEPWRPDGTPDGNARFFLKYGWWAFGSGERRTALHYALRAFRAKPTNRDAMKLALCAMLKPAPEPVRLV